MFVPVLLKEFGPIDYVDFSPVEPHYFAVTCSVRVQLYNPITKQVAKNFSRFHENAYGGAFRSDGQLLCAGGEESIVKLFDIESKSPLRVFKGHTRAVHRCFFTSDKTHIASFSDDKSVGLWDIPSEKLVTQFSEHADYVRAGAVSPVSADSVLSGGYDKFVHLYDTRTNASVFKVDHGAPVESVLFLPTGGIFLSAGGTEIRVWDVVAGGRLLAKLCHHHKTITCLCLASQNKRLLSGSLDRHVKIYDIPTFSVVHTLDYPNAVLSVGVSAGDTTVVAGMVDGLVSVARRDEEVRISKQERKKVSYRYASDTALSVTVNAVMLPQRRAKHTRIDKALLNFNYSQSLDIALARTPKDMVGACLELIRRKGLVQALAGRTEKSLKNIVRFLIKHIVDDRFTRVLIDVSNQLLDVYEDVEDLNPVMIGLFKRLAERLKREEKLTEELLALQGSLQMILTGVGINESSTQFPVENVTNMEPSVSASSRFIVSV